MYCLAKIGCKIKERMVGGIEDGGFGGSGIIVDSQGVMLQGISNVERQFTRKPILSIGRYETQSACTIIMRGNGPILLRETRRATMRTVSIAANLQLIGFSIHFLALQA